MARGLKTLSFFCHRCDRTIEGSWARHRRRIHEPKDRRESPTERRRKQ